MKKALLILGVTFALFSCNKTEDKKDNFKTAYIDTVKLLKDYDKYKDEEEKFKVKSQELGRPLEAKLQAFQTEAAGFQRNAQIKGMAWAQQKGAELQQREQQLSMEQEAFLRQIQVESDSIRNSIVTGLKDYIKEYGKKEGYDYIYGTGDAQTILFAKEPYDITDTVLKKLNEEFTSKNGSKAKKEDTEEVKEDKK
ncbi:membrane protein [Flavobacterium sp. 316]|uniref:OmpH family outer membrane protein n=1 Tax=Flavobacterium sediminilitoris TaxID=2024526 RepID=A0ABY4HPW0_9FLAO|nr:MULTISPECIES: OmpH family outer membrane protein [Flavobacterium]KIX20530.1 membrane protein [Flavobacterium sp. 316]UOX34904.1 OmpH family outer membrane protein [Flavobacterium sediminilitoris]